MKVTSAEANKMLKKLKDDYNALIQKEAKCSSFVAAVGEDLEVARPKYDFAETQKKLTEMEVRIRKMKHALSVFNTTTVVPGFDMTIDEMLVLIPMLNARKEKLEAMKEALPKERVERTYRNNSSVIEYTYANYDIEQAEGMYDEVCEKLAQAQLALDAVNNTVELELD